MQAIQFELFKTYAKAEVLISVTISYCRAFVGNNEGSRERIVTAIEIHEDV